MNKFLILFLSVALNLSAQNFYSGSVIDQDGNPVFGANVFVKNSTNGTQTDFDGNFIIEAKIKDVLVISYVGFKNQEFVLSLDNDLGKITLIEDVSTLDEVVVIGYGNQKKRNINKFSKFS